MRWGLRVKQPDGAMTINEFCRQKKLTSSVPPILTGEEFQKARDKALLDACVAWNALDISKKYRISIPGSTEGCPDIQLVKGYEPTGSESESESASEDDTND